MPEKRRLDEGIKNSGLSKLKKLTIKNIREIILKNTKFLVLKILKPPYIE